jgi:hypothetical protein
LSGVFAWRPPRFVKTSSYFLRRNIKVDTLLAQIQTALTTYLPNVLWAILILIIGWIVALALSALVRNLLKRTSLDDRLARTMGAPGVEPSQIHVEKWVATAVFWLVILFTLVAFFSVLNVPAISGPLGTFLNQIVTFLPGLIGALVLLAIAWLVATVLRAIVVRVLNASGLTRRLAQEAEVRPQQGTATISQTIGNVVYWLVFLFFLPAILSTLNMQGLLMPVQGLVNEILAFLPNLLGAALILVIGFLVARIVRQIITNLLAGVGVDNFGARVGLTNAMGQLQLSQVLGTVVYVLILVPVVVAALNALNIPAVSQPAANMLNSLLNALPSIFGALLLLAIAYFVARLVGTFVAGILANLGFDSLFRWFGLYVDPRKPTPPPPSLNAESAAPGTSGEMAASGASPSEAGGGRMTPSALVGYLVTIAIMLFAAMEAADLLGFGALTLLISRFAVAAGQVLVGLLIFAIGLYFSYLADRVIRSSGAAQSNVLATAARVAIIVFAAALALREMGIAESIVNLAFGLLLGAIAVAVALAFGLGGREAAARQIERWRQDVDRQLGRPNPPTGP